jgi:serine/threonine-protein kinase
MTGARARPVTGSHRPPPPRRTFSSGQRALLWAAGVLGALAIVIAVLLVLQYRDRQDTAPQDGTDTSQTITQTPTAPATPGNWTPDPRIGQGGQDGYFPLGATALPGPPSHDENYQ